MIRTYSIVALVFGLSLACSAYTAQPKLTKSRLSDMLQQPTVSAIHRDSYGILWIGTQQGLHRYDGANLTVFNSDRGNKNQIPDSEIKDIAEDIDGNLFVATSSGALLQWRRDSATFKIIIGHAPIGETKLTRLLVSKKGSIWLLGRESLSVYDTASKNLTEWIAKIQIPNLVGTPRDILEDTSGNIWVSGDLGIACFLLQKKSIELIDITTLGFPEQSSITALELLDPNRLLIGTDTGHILIWDISAATSLASAHLGRGNHVYISAFLQYERQLIIGTDRGLYASDRNLSYFNIIGETIGELSNPNIHSLFRDGKYIWIGTINGLDILSFTPFELFNEKNSGISEDILTFEEDREGRIWIGTYDGLYLFNDDTKRHSKYMNDAQSTSLDERVATIAAQDDTLWLGLIRGGVRTFDTISGQHKTRNMAGNEGGAITKIISMAESEDILIATYDKGLFRITHGDIRSYFDDGSLPEKTITALFLSKAGALLAASGNRLYKYFETKDQFSRVKLSFGLGGRRPIIYSFAQTATEDILIGTKDNGIFLWSRENQLNANLHVEPFGNRGALDYSTIYGIESDLEGSIWCSTEKGIVKLDSDGVFLKRFTVADGLQGIDYTLGASFKSQSGLIYFGGMNGYNRFDPTQIDIDDSASSMRLTDISLPRQESRHLGDLTELKSLQLTHKDHFVTFQFSVLDFIDAEKNQFRYKLDNFDSEWIENGTRNTATYTNLPAGEFVLRVQGANSAGIWNREGITLGVTVLPAPWRTWWAKVIYCVGLLILSWGLLRIYRSYAIERRSVQLAQEMFEAENRADDDMQEQMELQDEIVFSSYQHSLTTLSLVSDSISSRSTNLPDDIKQNLTESSIRRISALSSLEDFLSFQAGGPIVNLHKYTDRIFSDLLKNAPVNPETIITINEVTAMPLPAELASPMAIVLYELLENSVQHAFEQDSPANYIQVRMSLDSTEASSATTLELSISDNGIGVPDKIEELATEGSGIAIVNAIVSRLDGSLEFSGESGTLVSVIIPYHE